MAGDPRASSDRMVVYEGVSKFFPVRVRLGSAAQPELMVADDMQNRAKWARRIIAFGGMALLIAAMMGACMKM